MPDITTDRISNRGAEIEQKKASAAARYLSLWQEMVIEWRSPEETDRAWLLYSANYLLRTGGVRWAMDPLTLRQRVPAAPEADVTALAMLEYVVLTHRHADHLDLGLLRLLRDSPVHWIVPEALLDPLRSLNLSREKLTIAYPLETLQLGGLTLIPFDGQHWEADPTYPDGRRGVPATGYLAEFNGKRWLFPGDTRTFDISLFPAFGSVDGLFAHLWLGRGQALREKPPLLDAFCRFCLGFQPRQVVVTHLEEFGRSSSEYWDEWHFQSAEEWFYKNVPHIPIRSARMGERVEL